MRRCLLLLLLLMTAPAQASPAGVERTLVRQIRFDQRLDAQVPMDTRFTTAAGAAVALRDLLGDRPAILLLGYYTCKNLCDSVLTGLISSLNNVRLTAGRDYDVIAVSIDPADTPVQATRRKALTAARYFRAPAAAGWHFLTGDRASIRRVADSVGFHYAYDPERREYLHASGIVVLTPQGRVSRYFYGVSFPIRDLRLGLVEASANRIGSPVDQLLLRCFHYDPATGKYSLAIVDAVRIGGVAAVLALGGFIVLMLARERRPGGG